jgi:hypothetical protein
MVTSTLIGSGVVFIVLAAIIFRLGFGASQVAGFYALGRLPKLSCRKVGSGFSSTNTTTHLIPAVRIWTEFVTLGSSASVQSVDILIRTRASRNGPPRQQLASHKREVGSGLGSRKVRALFSVINPSTHRWRFNLIPPLLAGNWPCRVTVQFK